jgi:hypothetical protein
MEKMKCENCKFANHDCGPKEGGGYSCRRHAPRPRLNGEIDVQMLGGMMICWPGVHPEDWCGEYQPKASA